MNLLDIVIINYNTGNLTAACIDSILDTFARRGGIIVVDNNSSDDSVEFISQRYPDIKIIRNPENYGYARAVNIGVSASDSEYVLVTNSDVIYHNNSIDNLVEFMDKNRDSGVACFQQEFPDGSWQQSYGHYPGFKLAFLKVLLFTSISRIYKRLFYKKLKFDSKPKKVEFADGAALVIRRKVFDEVGGFDESFFFYTEETDFCMRINATAYSVYFVPYGVITHIRGGSSDGGGFNEKAYRMLVETKLQFIRKHGTDFEAKVFLISQRIFYFTISALERIAAAIFSGGRKNRLIDKYDLHYKIYKLWLEMK